MHGHLLTSCGGCCTIHPCASASDGASTPDKAQTGLIDPGFFDFFRGESDYYDFHAYTHLPNGNGTWSVTGAHDANGINTDGRCFNLATIRQTPNPPVTATWQVHPNCNTPLTSAHAGGVNALRGDGSVVFLTDSIALAVLQSMADRDDGGVVP